jgi:predicted acyltransferase
MNAIAAYTLAEIGAALLGNIHLSSQHTIQYAIYSNLFAPLADPYMASLLYALVYVSLCWLAMWCLYRKRIFLKL